MPTVREQLVRIRRQLEKVSCEADSEAKIILAHVYGTSPGGLLMRLLHEAAGEEQIARIVQKRLKGAPLAYVLNSAPFYGREYYVDERVLIPRFDTECVAERALQEIQQRGLRTCADICCGSGCIGITLLAKSALQQVIFSDISEEALAVCRCNLQAAAGGDRAVVCRADLFDSRMKPVDLIVSNPPYISGEEFTRLDSQVKDYEPRLALYGGEDGLQFYKRLTGEGRDFLTEDGVLLVEIGSSQKEAVQTLFADAGFVDVTTGTDLGGLPRWVCGRKG